MIICAFLIAIVLGIGVTCPSGLAHAMDSLDGRILGPDGKRSGEIRREPLGGYSLFDDKSRRLGYGRESSDGRTIEFFGPDGRRLFEIRRDGRPGGPPSRKRD